MDDYAQLCLFIYLLPIASKCRLELGHYNHWTAGILSLEALLPMSFLIQSTCYGRCGCHAIGELEYRYGSSEKLTYSICA